MVNLHQHTTFSDGFGFPNEIVKYSKNLGYTSAAITDHRTISGFYYHEIACHDLGIKPIYGVEVEIIPQIDLKNKISFHTLVLSKNLAGIHDLYKIITLSNDAEHFYKKPRIDLDNLAKYSNNFIILSGCVKNPIASAYNANDIDKANELLNYYNRVFDFYYEIQPYNSPEMINSTNFILKNKAIRTVATLDAHYMSPDEATISKFIFSVRAHRAFNDIENILPLFLRSEEDLFRELENIYDKNTAKTALENIDKIDNQIEAYDLPRKGEQITTAQDIEKLKFLIKSNYSKIPHTKEYIERLKKELDTIIQANYVKYFLKTYDIVKMAKENNVLTGYGRGSAVSSLICYLLGITNVDPIKHNLLFERFISSNRHDPPDIDLDFDNEGRNLLIKKLHQDYQILQISTFNQYKLGNLLDDAGRVFEIKPAIINKIKSTGVDSFAEIKDSRILDNIPYLDSLVKLEGQIRYVGRHASGFILEKDLDSYTPTIFGEATPFDYETINNIGLLKFDILGLKTLSVLKNLGNITNTELEDIKFDDEKVFDYFTTQRTLGIFQFEGAAAKSVVKQLHPHTMEDLCLANALTRPGPLQSGLTYKCLRGETDQVFLKYPNFLEITKNTRSSLVYQEQIMLFCKSLGITLEDTETIRKLISKSKFLELQNFRKYFDDAEVWDKIIQFGKYAFNKSHSIAYSYLSYLTAYFKKYYLKEFYLANLLVEPRNMDFVMEALHSGIEFSSIKSNGDKNWKLINGKLVPGITFIYGEGAKSKLKKSILDSFSDSFIIEEYFKAKEVKVYKTLSDEQLHDAIYVPNEIITVVPAKIKKKSLIENGFIIFEDYTRVEVETKITKEVLNMFKNEIESVGRNDLVAIKIQSIPWSNKVKLLGIYNLTKRDGITLESEVNL